MVEANSQLDNKLREFKRAKAKQTATGWLMITPFIVLTLFFGVLPIVLGIIMSFQKYNIAMPDSAKWMTPTIFQNYVNLFNFTRLSTQEFWTAFGATMIFDIIAVPLIIIIPLALAALVNLHPPGYKIFRAIIYLPSVVSIAIVGIVFASIFGDNAEGLFNSVFSPDNPIVFMNTKLYQGDFLRWMVMFICSIWWQTGTNFVIFSGALRDVPKSLYEACEMDGGGSWTSTKHVTLPNIRPSIAICLFNTLIGYLGLYGQPTVINGPLNKNEFFSPMMMIQTYLTDSSYWKQTGFVCAMAAIFGVVVVILSTVERIAMAERLPKAKHSTHFKSHQITMEFDFDEIDPRVFGTPVPEVKEAC